MAIKQHCAAELRMPRVMIQTLGCAKNAVDSETLAGLLKQGGFDYVERESQADVVVVNTCGFIDDAKVESIQVMLEAVRWKQARQGTTRVRDGLLDTARRPGDSRRASRT
jgi:tRNA A37 methylthiotransferase MiaB